MSEEAAPALAGLEGAITTLLLLGVALSPRIAPAIFIPGPPPLRPTVPVVHPNAPELPGRSRRRAKADPAAVALAKTSRSAKPVRTAVAARHLSGVRSVSGTRMAGTRLRGGVL